MKLHKNTICKLKGLTAVILCTAALMVLGSCSMGLLSDANPAQTTASSYTLQAIEGYTDLFQINGLSEDDEQICMSSEVSVYEDLALVTEQNDGSVRLMLLDTASGKLLAQKTIPTDHAYDITAVLRDASTIFCYDQQTGAAVLYDLNFREAASFSVDAGSTSGVMLKADGSGCYYLEKESGTLFEVSYDEEKKAFTEPQAVKTFGKSNIAGAKLNGTLSTSHGVDYIITLYTGEAYDASVYAWNASAQKLSEIGEINRDIWTEGKNILVDKGDEICIFSPDTPKAYRSIPKESEREYLIRVEAGLIATLEYMTNTETENAYHLRLYDQEMGTITDSIFLQGSDGEQQFYVRDAAIVANGRVFLTVSSNERTLYYLWSRDGTADDNDENPYSIVGEVLTSEIRQSEEIYKLASKIEAAYQVGVFYGDDVVRYFPEYVVVPENDSEVILDALKKLEEILSKFPEGFLVELFEGVEANGLDIYLCGSLRPHTSDVGIDTAAAFTVVYEGRQMIAMDLSYANILERHLSHELMHAIDNKISALVQQGKSSGFELWSAMLPEGFEYTYQYRDESGNTIDSFNSPEYTSSDPDSAGDKNKIYFVDGYSKTYPTEDRARIFESLFISKNSLSSMFESKNLMIKAQYLCAVIRESFECIDDTTDVWWEHLIEQTELSEFYQNYEVRAED